MRGIPDTAEFGHLLSPKESEVFRAWRSAEHEARELRSLVYRPDRGTLPLVQEVQRMKAADERASTLLAAFLDLMDDTANGPPGPRTAPPESVPVRAGRASPGIRGSAA